MDKQIIYGITIFIMLFTVVFVYAANKYSRIFWCATVGMSNFNEVEKKIFIDNELEKNDSTRLHLLIKKAKLRITNKFGPLASKPIVIVVDEHKSALKYGVGPGQQSVRAYITPWEKYLVINSNTLNIDLLAHEYFHIEISERIGYVVFKTKLPVWLDEGLALQVDYRERYKLDKVPFNMNEVDRVKRLKGSSEFFTNNNEQYIRNMLAAKAAVIEILNQHPRKSLYLLFSRIDKGETVIDVFSNK